MQLDIYQQFVDKDIINRMVQMTNSYANKTQFFIVITRHMSLNKWTDCTEEEMRLKKRPPIRDYWSKKILYKNKVGATSKEELKKGEMTALKTMMVYLY